MPRGIVKVLRANGSIILETVLTENLRIQIPSNLKEIVSPPVRIKVTIEKLGELKKP